MTIHGADWYPKFAGKLSWHRHCLTKPNTTHAVYFQHFGNRIVTRTVAARYNPLVLQGRHREPSSNTST